MPTPANNCLGFGLGLRKEHYGALLEAPPAVDWLEVLTENYLVPGGMPLYNLERIRAHYPVVMHGVSLSIGGTSPLDWNYLRQLRELARRIEPRWISDHLCWTGTAGTNLHDLMPLPYDEATLRHVIERVTRVQDYLGRQILLENVSSYLGYAHSTMTEWEFLRAIAIDADCLILLDINNIFVSARNHDFDAMTYLNALPIERVRQLHLAGHHDHGDYIVDTHDAAIIDPVWALYRAAVRRLGSVATMIERDDDMPPLAELVAELEVARHHAATASEDDDDVGWKPIPDQIRRTVRGPALATLQQDLQAHVLNPRHAIPASIAETPRVNRAHRVKIYTSGYRRRLIEALATDFPALNALLGTEGFAEVANDYLQAYPSRHFSLRWFGAHLSEFLENAAAHHAWPLIAQMARFEWALGETFDAADAPSAAFADLINVPAAAWAELRIATHPSVRAIRLGSLVPSYWRAITEGTSISAAAPPGELISWRLWRQSLRNLFRSMAPLEAVSTRWLETETFGSLCDRLSEDLPIAEVPGYAAGLLRTWLNEGSITRVSRGIAHTAADLLPRKSA
ncbi:MAG: DUF692 family protein [Gammaproteobacteria bacterium]|nr:DUF692 family protein [Gammaproteobacteria bacterium]